MKKIICTAALFLFITSVAFGEEILEENFFEDEVYHGVLSMEGEFLDGDLLRISVVTGEMVQPVLGMAFNLLYDYENLAFLKYEPGEFLERGGDPFYLVKNEEGGRIIFGETLRRDDSFPVGGGEMADFYFQILTEGEFSFSFSNGVVSTLDVVRQDIDKILWENFSVARGDGGELVVLDGGANSTFQASTFNFSRFVPWIVVIFGAGVSFLTYFLWKKQEKKRPESSVNFK